LAIRNCFLYATLLDDRKFCVESSLIFNAYQEPSSVGYNFDRKEVRDEFAFNMNYLASNYFSRRNYFRIDRRPVVFIYNAFEYSGMFSKVFSDVRKDVMDLVGVEPYLVGHVVAWSKEKDFNQDTLLGDVDAIMDYNPLPLQLGKDLILTGDLVSSYMMPWFSYWNVVAERRGIKHIPTVVPGFDNTRAPPQISGKAPVVSRTEDGFQTFLRESVPLMQVGLHVTSYNEWFEGTQIERAKEYGRDYLGILKATLTP
jgi:hypothetical protein